MDALYHTLLTPEKISNVEIKNRIGMCPMGGMFWGKWLEQNSKALEDLKGFMDEIHKTGAKLFIQLTAGMLFCRPIDLLAARALSSTISGWRENTSTFPWSIP